MDTSLIDEYLRNMREDTKNYVRAIVLADNRVEHTLVHCVPSYLSQVLYEIYFRYVEAETPGFCKVQAIDYIKKACDTIPYVWESEDVKKYCLSTVDNIFENNPKNTADEYKKRIQLYELRKGVDRAIKQGDYKLANSIATSNQLFMYRYPRLCSIIRSENKTDSYRPPLMFMDIFAFEQFISEHLDPLADIKYVKDKDHAKRINHVLFNCLDFCDMQLHYRDQYYHVEEIKLFTGWINDRLKKITCLRPFTLDEWINGDARETVFPFKLTDDKVDWYRYV